MQYIKFKSVHIFSNGSSILYDSNLLKPKVITFSEKNLKNIEFSKKKLVLNVKLKYSSTYKNKYFTTK